MGPSLCRMERILRPTRLMAVHAGMTWTFPSCDKSLTSDVRAASCKILVLGSTETVTLVSDVEMRSIEIACVLKMLNKSAKNPISCHIPKFSTEKSVTLDLLEMDFTQAYVVSISPSIRVPPSLGASVL